MTTTSRKIAFEAQDNGVLSTFDKIEKSAQELSRELMQEAAAFSNSGKDQLKYIEDQIKAIEKRNKLDKERGVVDIAEHRDAQITGGANPAQANLSYRESIAELNKIAREDTLQTTLLKELINASKAEILENAKADFIESAAADGVGPTAIVLPGGGGGREESEGEEEDQEEKDKKEKEKKGKPVDAVEKEVNSRTTSLLDNPVQAIVQALPFVGGALGIMAALGTQLDASQGRYRATTGYEGTRDANMGGYGLTTTEFLDREATILRAQGEHHGKGTRELIQQGIAYGVDPGTLANYASTERSQIDTKTTAQSLDEMLAIFHKSQLFEIGPHSFINIEEKIRFQTQLNEMQTQQYELISNDVSTRIQEAFGKIGGSFGDQRAIQTMQSVNGALTNPDNEYKQAFMYSSLQKVKPNSSLFEMQEMQEKGIFADGFMQQVLDDLVGQMGGKEAISGSSQLKDMLMTNVREMLGLNSGQSRLLTDQYMAGNADFSKVGQTTSGKFGWESSAGEVDQLLATMQEELAKLGDKGIDATADIVRNVTNGIDQKGVGGYIGEQMGNAAGFVGDAFMVMIDNITKYFEEKWDLLMQKFSDLIEGLSPTNWFGSERMEYKGPTTGYGYHTD